MEKKSREFAEVDQRDLETDAKGEDNKKEGRQVTRKKGGLSAKFRGQVWKTPQLVSGDLFKGYHP